MNKKNLSYLSSGVIQRKDFQQLLFASLQTEAMSFANRLALMWLEKYPGDLEIQYIHARILANEGKYSEAKAVLEQLAEFDPEFVEAQELLVKLSDQNQTHPSVDNLACIYAMGKPIYADFSIPDWSFIFRTAWQEFLAEQYDDADHLIQQVISIKPNLALAAILHQRIVSAKGSAFNEDIANRQLIHLYHQRFPNSLHFTLSEADLLMADGSDMDAVELLYQCVTNDSLGVVANRLWGANHRYKSLWPDQYEMEFNAQVPVEVMSFLGLNMLQQGDASQAQPAEEGLSAPEQLDGASAETLPLEEESVLFTETESAASTVEVVDQIFEKLAKKLKQPELKRTDGRFPVHVILSLKNNLIKKYGKQTFLVLDTEMQSMAAAIRAHLGWGSVVVYPDDPVNMVSYGLTTLESIDPWKIKTMLVELDSFLGKKGEMIGSLLIVGGDEIVPFHQLPNPTDDMDEVVKSDNPYAATDGNYFVQEWPVGRIPDEAGSDAGFLLSQIRAIIATHTVEKKPSRSSLLQSLLSLFMIFKKARAKKNGKRKTLTSIGYSAAIWQAASKAAYKPIEYGSKLFTSPPEQTGTIKSAKFSASSAGYFNLHGVEDGSEWYGQRETGDLKSQIDYPIALTPREIIKGSVSPEIVFSEACYGGFVDGKTEDQSIALKYLGIGAPAFIGSTCIAYGSIDTPLIGADLLANYFWKNMTSANTLGDAFIQAKLDFTKEMDKRQGFLDGEDQKTLLSFVFYGDPLTGLSSQQTKSKRAVKRILAPKVNIMSDDEDMADFEQDISAETLHEVKKIAEVYLPGLEELNIHVSQQQMLTDPGFEEEAGGGKINRSVRRNGRGQTVVTVSKTVPVASKVHRHYLRARVDRNGHVDKVAVSR
jgi:tetratricopeptide (TPR) repeat protein